MNDMALVQWVTGAMGVIVLAVGQRMPKFTQFGVGFGVAVGSVIYWRGIPEDSALTAMLLLVGMLGGVVVLAIRRLLPLTLGAVVGSYVAWCAIQYGWGIDLFRAHPDWLVAGSFGLSVLGVVAVNRLIAVTERISIAIAGAVLLCASLGVVHRIEWVIGFALVSLAIDGLRRE